MLDANSTATLERVRGEAHARFGAGRLRDLYQRGAAKIMLPRGFGDVPEVVFLNTAGGITGDDRLDYGLHIESGAVVATTQTAERAYKSGAGCGELQMRIVLEAGAKLCWLPQELILFNGASIDRKLRVEMARDAELVLLESVVLGREAMGETLSQIDFRDRREVRQGDRPVLLEAIRLTDEDLSAGAAGLDGARAFASLSLIAEDAGARLPALRAALKDADPVRAAASCWQNRLSVRFLSADAHALRHLVAHATEALTKAPIPRVWQL